MGQIIELLKSINYQVSKELLFNYKKMNITDREFIIIIYLINQPSDMYNPKQISNDLNINLNTVFEEINSLCEKNIIKIEVKRINKVLTETINLDSLYGRTNQLKYKEAFKEENSKHNLISKNDESLLYEKHIYDSLGIKIFLEIQIYDILTIN